MDEWQTRLATHLTQGNVDALPEVLILIGALIACSTFALVQFFTMLGTRWGDKNPAPKSFILAILIHVVVMLAWSTAIAIRPVGAVMAVPHNLGEPIAIQDLGESGIGEDPFATGDTPVWQKLSEQPSAQRVRQDRNAYTPDDLADAPLQPVDAPRVDATELADVSVQPAAAASPQPQTSPAEPLIQQSPAPISGTGAETVAEARAEAGGRPSGRATMRRVEEIELDGDDEIPRTRGSGDAAAPNRPDDQSMSIPLPAAGEGDENPVLDGPPNETIRRGMGPAPSSAPDGEFIPDGRTDGTGSPKSGSGTGAKRFARGKSRRGSEGDGDLPGLDRIPGDGYPVAAASPDRTLRPSINGPGDQTGARPTPSLSTGGGPNLPNRSPATYKLRGSQQRRGAALRAGGSLTSEQAVENSLTWLAKNQEPAGFWSSRRHGGGNDQKDPSYKIDGKLLTRVDDGIQADSGITGLAMLAFMGAGYTQDEGEYADNVTRAILWLIRQQRNDGYLGGSAASYDQMYCHAIATFALAEACAMQEPDERSPEHRRAIRAAVDYIVKHQGTDGGWRYLRKFDSSQEGDMSMFGWQLMALKSADIAGIKVSPDVWNGMVEFLKKRSQGEHNGLASYNSSQPNATPAMTAEALFCKQMIGIYRTNLACQEAIAYLRQNLPRLTRYDEYYWYYGTLAMFQYGGEPWDEWNDAMRDLLVNQQETTGKDAGSWAPKGKWAGIGGRVYSTALSTLCLEVYYRYLPLYQTTQE